MKRLGFTILLPAVLLLAFVGCERKVTNENEKLIAAEGTATYIGSESCGSSTACHQDKWDTFKNTGHPFKLNEAEDVQQAGYYPFTEVPNPPAGVSWNDVDKVIGGFWWKARFIGTEAFNEGYIITGDSSATTQYNLVDSSWSGYHAGENKEYDCGPCHMTAYKNVGNQEGKPHLIGTWEFNGVQCEECHGPGSSHRNNPRKVAMRIDRSAEACGKCHIRGVVNKIEARGGFIRHHEQWNEMFTTKHRALDCVDCHDPHFSLHPSPANSDRPMAIKVECEGCHFEEAESFHASDLPHDTLACIDCHMPRAGKSAKAAGTYEGDVRTHLWRINHDADAEMFDTTGAKDYANGYLTVDFTCRRCHNDKTRSWASTNAERVHTAHMDEADGFNGGQLYNEFWMSETGFSESRKDTAFTAHSNFYRCKACHGWDLIGSKGAYIDRDSTATRPHVDSLDLFAFANNATPDELFAAIVHRTGRRLGEPLTDAMPYYGDLLTNDEIWDIVKYLKETRLDVTKLYYLNAVGTYPTGSRTFDSVGWLGDSARGDLIYAENCASTPQCHGPTGNNLDADIGKSIGEFARKKPYELQHKIRYGQLGSDMGAGFPYLTLIDLQDLFKALTDTVQYPDPAP